MGWQERISSDIAPPTLFHAVSQGALAIEIRTDDAQSRALCRAITHWQTEWRCAAERACLRVLEGGCSVPVGVSTELVQDGAGQAGVLKITGCVTSLTGDRHIEHTLEDKVASIADAEAVGARLATILLETGAKEILKEINEDREKRIGEAKSEEEKAKIEAAIAA